MMLLKQTHSQESNKQRKQRSKSDVYREALLAEWIIMSNYSPEDFHGKFEWPEMRPGTSAHFVAAA